MTEFLHGAVAMGFVVAALFFARAWRTTRDMLFLLFALAFLIEAVSRTALALDENPLEQRPVYYLPRFVAYMLIIAGIASKNLPPRK